MGWLLPFPLKLLQPSSHGLFAMEQQEVLVLRKITLSVTSPTNHGHGDQFGRGLQGTTLSVPHSLPPLHPELCSCTLWL